jgi:hypothetical protein
MLRRGKGRDGIDADIPRLAKPFRQADLAA